MTPIARTAARLARPLRPLAIMLVLMPGWAGTVTVEAPMPPTLVVDASSFPTIGSPESDLVLANGAVTIHYRLDPHESLILEALNLPAAVQRLEWHLRDHRVCGAHHAFVEVAYGPALGIVTFPEPVDSCVAGGIALPDEMVVLCQGSLCQGGAAALYRPPHFAPEEPVGFGAFQATYALLVDVTAGESFAGSITMRYSVGSVAP